MRWFFIVCGLCVLAVLIGCGEVEPPTPVSPPPPPTPAEVESVTIPAPEDAVIFEAPIGPGTKARVRKHPELAVPACEKGCEAVNAEMHRVGPADNRHGWECLCSRSG